MKSYKATFFKREETIDHKTGEVTDTSYKVLGTITLDDSNTSNTFPLVTKAMRHAPSFCQNADRVELTVIK